MGLGRTHARSAWGARYSINKLQVWVGLNASSAWLSVDGGGDQQ
jgi:hypothetical protein